MINKNNFMVWSATVDDFDYALPLIQGDQLEFYVNTPLDNTVDPYTNLKYGLWSEDTGIYLTIGGLNTITSHPDLGVNEYNVYSSAWTIPDLPNKATFRFILFYEPADIRYYSNPFCETTDSAYIASVKYKNANNTLGYLYETATTFYNRFSIDLWTGRSDYNENVSGYETYTGDFITSKSDIQKITEFQTRFFDQTAHEAFFTMLAHSEIYIDETRYKKQQGKNYEITWSEFDDNKIGNGAVSLLEYDYSAAVINCS